MTKGTNATDHQDVTLLRAVHYLDCVQYQLLVRITKVFHSPTDALLLILENTKIYIKIYKLPLHVSVYNQHQGAYIWAWLKLHLC
jgi:hypothetical protein